MQGSRKRCYSITAYTNRLINWYEKALRGKYSNLLGNTLLQKMRNELAKEFPSIDEVPEIISSRHYERKNNPEWKTSSI